VRETTGGSTGGESGSRDSPREELKAKEGKRGGDDVEEGGDDSFGRSGRVVEGAGLGEGTVRRESREM